MWRALAELDRVDAGLRPRRSSRRGDLGRRVVAGVVAAALLSAFGSAFAYKQFGLRLTAEGLRLAQPLGRPPDVATGLGSFAFVATQRGSHRPVAYDPCRPVEYLVNDTLAPAGSDALLRSALDEISTATGLVFTSVGTTDELPTSPGVPVVPRREPVLIAWTTPDQVPDLAGRTAGIGGSVARYDEFAGESQFLTGLVALDAPQLAPAMTTASGPQELRAIIIHELGHLVGLDHVEDPNELMYSDNVGKLELGPGDREGLAALGAGSCFH